MRKLTIHKELFKTDQTGFVKSCTVVNTIQFHNLDYLISRSMSGNPRQSWILDSTPWILVQVLDSVCFVSGNGIPDSNR